MSILFRGEGVVKFKLNNAKTCEYCGKKGGVVFCATQKKPGARHSWSCIPCLDKRRGNFIAVHVDSFAGYEFEGGTPKISFEA